MGPFHTITVQRATTASSITYDDRGTPVTTWADHLEVQASNQPISVEELAQMSQAGPVSATHRIYVPGSPDITEDDRIIDGGRTFQIDGVADPAGFGHHLAIEAHVVSDSAWETAA
jgi:SPP1 family predicted phage head-tail adaptor